MAFWAKKKETETEKKETGATNLLKKKEEKKGAPPKRIDNLRIAQKLQISLRSLGTGNEYHFLTKDLSATGMFVLCSDHKRYPFQVQSTLLETIVLLKAENDNETYILNCLCKIARIVEGQVSGFGVRIVQIAPEQRTLLEQFIAKHGSPENMIPYNGPVKSEDKGFAAPMNSAQEASEIGQDTLPNELPTSA